MFFSEFVKSHEFDVWSDYAFEIDLQFFTLVVDASTISF